MIKPLVSICITTYNRDFMIKDAINRVFDQTYSNIELIVVDDCSNDKTSEICVKTIEELKSKQANYFRHDKNSGLATARNTAIFNSSGKYFTFIDDDDSWDSTFIEEFVNLADKYNSDWCFCCGVKSIHGAHITEVIPNFDGKLKDYFVQGFAPPVASQFYHTSVLKKFGGYNTQILTCVDHDLWLNLAINGLNLKSLNKALAIPNSDLTLNRMTTNSDKRLINLEKSLVTWKPIIIENFGSQFYDNFCEAYRYREKTGFMFKKLSSGGLGIAMKYYFNNKNIISLKFVIRCFLKIVLSKSGIRKSYSRQLEYRPSLVITN